MKNDTFISTTEAAKIAGCTVPTIHRWLGLPNTFEFEVSVRGIQKIYMVDKQSFLEFLYKKRRK